jgi:hypothetical protein
MEPHTIIIYLKRAIALVALLYLWVKNRRQRDFIDYYEKATSRHREELAEKEDEMDALFIQLLQWREYTEEYQRLVAGLVPVIKNTDIDTIVADLDDRFHHLYQITETDRERYMKVLRTNEGFAGDYQKLTEYLVNKLLSLKSGEKAEESSILNVNREN